MPDESFNFGEDVPVQEGQVIRAQLQNPLDVQSRGLLRTFTREVLPELNRVQSLTLRSGDTTFDVRGSDQMSLTSASAVTISTITSGYNGQLLTLLFNDANVTFTHNATGARNTLNLGGANYTGSANTTAQFVFNGTSWFLVNVPNVRAITAGENLTANDAVYLLSSDSRVYRTDADAAGTTYPFIGFVLATVTTGNTAIVQTSGIVDGFTGLTSGSVYYLSNTTGAIGTAAGTRIKQVGIAISTTALNIQIGQNVFQSSTAIAAAGGTTTVTVGFLVSTVYCLNNGNNVAMFGFYSLGSNFATREASALSTTRCSTITAGGAGTLINNVTATTFDFVADNTGTAHTIYWVAIGA